MDEKEFFMVWGGKKSPPAKQHETYETAIEEAKRLSSLEDSSFYVLKAVSVVSVVKLTEIKNLAQTTLNEHCWFR